MGTRQLRLHACVLTLGLAALAACGSDGARAGATVPTSDRDASPGAAFDAPFDAPDVPFDALAALDGTPDAPPAISTDAPTPRNDAAIDAGPDPNVDPLGVWVNATSNLAGMASECGNLSYLASKPDENMMIAGVAQKGLWMSRDAGNTWQAMGSGPGSAPITNRTSSFVFDPDHPQRFWESGIYNGGGVYATADDGTTFLQQGSITHIDSVGVDFTDPARKTLLAGGHEQKQTLYRSTDGGQTWAKIGPSFPAGTNFSNQVMVLDGQTHFVGCSGYAGGTGGIFRTPDGGGTWTHASAEGGVGRPLRASDGSIYWLVDGNGGLVRSTDQGATWTNVGGKGVVAGAPLELPDGRIIALGSKNVMLSADRGASWKAIANALPFTPNGLAYSPYRRALFVWHFTCGNGLVPVPADAIMRAHFDYQTQ